jgi:hypothetical protein
VQTNQSQPEWLIKAYKLLNDLSIVSPGNTERRNLFYVQPQFIRTQYVASKHESIHHLQLVQRVITTTKGNAQKITIALPKTKTPSKEIKPCQSTNF